VLDEAGITQTIHDFAVATANARRAGFDGVEIHGGHGYLADQFLWERTNHRDDGYGISDRTRFLRELIAAYRQAGGPEFPLILRLSLWKSVDFSARIATTAQELESLLAPLVDAGVDAFHVSTRRFWEPAFDGDSRTLPGWFRKLT
jgi:2,4-dienoyl-CoA reductase-like NADH-dependent reductase (Old Yellow Enzyme family)